MTVHSDILNNVMIASEQQYRELLAAGAATVAEALKMRGVTLESVRKAEAEKRERAEDEVRRELKKGHQATLKKIANAHPRKDRDKLWAEHARLQAVIENESKLCKDTRGLAEWHIHDEALSTANAKGCDIIETLSFTPANTLDGLKEQVRALEINFPYSPHEEEFFIVKIIAAISRSVELIEAKQKRRSPKPHHSRPSRSGKIRRTGTTTFAAR